ncbi:MAG: hypothetical protein MK066_04185 [Crocinitomicaceae bacterium]|nr:hypothetical protein [Crocinitomicaceae bacterium]
MENEFLDRAQLEEKKSVADKKKKERAARLRKRKERKSSAFIQILNGDFFTKDFMLANLPFIFFIMFLLLLSVSKGYYGKQLTKDVKQTQGELDELTSDYFEAKVRLEEDTQRKKLAKRLASKGLKETVNPTKVIRIEKKK